MRTITLKSVPDELYKRLKASARAGKRSMNSEALSRLESALERKPLDVEAFLREAREARAKMRMPVLTNRFINAAKRRGRP